MRRWLHGRGLEDAEPEPVTDAEPEPVPRLSAETSAALDALRELRAIDRDIETGAHAAIEQQTARALNEALHLRIATRTARQEEALAMVDAMIRAWKPEGSDRDD